MPGPGQLGGPGLPGHTRIANAQLASKAVMETDEFNHFIKLAERSGDQLMEQITTDMEYRAQRYAPKRTGKLRRSIKGILLNGKRESRVISDVPYAGVMEEGSRPHLIHGVRANFRFKNGRRFFVWNDPRYGPVGGTGNDRDGYANWTEEAGATVRHPGTKPHWFFKRAFQETFVEARFLMTKAYGRR